MDPKDVVREGVSSQVGLRALQALDSGRFADAIELYEEGVTPVDGVEGALWNAEVAIYLGRLGEAEEALEEPVLQSGGEIFGQEHAALRKQLLTAGLQIAKGEYTEAEESLKELTWVARDAEDTLIEMRAWFDLARIAWLRSDWTQALELFAIASSLAGQIGNSYYRGRCSFHRASSLYESGDIEAAELAYQEAIGLLAFCENLRQRANAENGYAGLLVATGRYEEALELLARAEATVTRIGNIPNIQIIRNATTWALYALERYDEVLERVRGLIDMDRAGGDMRAEAFGLRLMACVALAQGRDADALKAATEMTSLLEMMGDEDSAYDGKLLVARCRSRRGDAKAIADLRGSVEAADESTNSYRSALTRIYLADALHTVDPLEAARIFAEAKELADRMPNAWVRAELRALERASSTWPVRVGTDGSLIICLSAKLPMREEVHDILDKVLLRTALERANGKFAAAGRLIGEKRWNMRHLALQHGIALPARRETTADGNRRSRNLEDRGE
jgi:tetratricopeptide (TPR) repeat protein